jgi:BirA family biotin operon repressor/biotin-[acetyl-CoA-carboxylase] ligase
MFNFVKISAKISKFRTMANKHDIMWLDSVDSTNDEAARRISDIDNLSVLSARDQFRGRGQRGNSWSSAPGENLTFSIILKYAMSELDAINSDYLPPLQTYDQFAVSEVAALSVTDFLAECGISAKIKWPNDIYVDGRKICGILIENSIRGKNLTHSIVGIGLNVNQCNFDASLPNPTSMQLYLKGSSGKYHQSFDMNKCLEAIMEIFKGYVQLYMNGKGGLGRLRRMYLSQLWRKDERTGFTDCRTGMDFYGTIRGVSDTGYLIVENEKGELKEFAFKEISYIL